MQRARSARVRTAALTTTVGLCLLIPLAAASADSARFNSPGADGGSTTVAPVPHPSGSYEFGNGVDPGAPEGADAVKQLLAGTNAPVKNSANTQAASGASAVPKATGGPANAAGAGDPKPSATATGPAVPNTAASTAVSNAVCGKAVEVAGGVRAQTCVEREGSEVWARSYYRNPTSEPLLMVVSLLRPDNSTIEVRCTVEAGASDGQCETPRLRTDQPLALWSAISEVATADASRKILRSGTASAVAAG